MSTTNLQHEVSELIIDTLNLDISANEIDPNAPLFGDSGLELDSIDALELAYAISKKYKVELQADNNNNEKIFESVASLTDYIQSNIKN